MKLFITLSLTFLCLQAFSQDQITILRDTSDKKRDGLILSNGKVIWEGEQIKCGRGTLPSGDFKYIHSSNTSWLNIVSMDARAPKDGTETAIGRQYSGLMLTVKKVKKVGTKRLGYKYQLVVGGGNIVNYQCEIEDALAVGEIVF